MKFDVCERFVRLNRLKVFSVINEDCKKVFDKDGYLKSIILKKSPTLEMQVNGKTDNNSLKSYDAAALIKNENKIILLPLCGGEFSLDEETKGRLQFFLKPNFLIDSYTMKGWYNSLEKISEIEKRFEQAMFGK